jgi:fatty-acyl-CoA synthase
MKGLMQDWPLLVHTIIDYAAINHGEREVVSRIGDGPLHRTTYAEINTRAKKLSSALKRRGYGYGDVIATMAWNSAHHLESWYAIAGLGAVCHTLNPRLFEEQLIYIINHAEDKLIFVDADFIPLIEKLKDKLPAVQGIVVFGAEDDLPASKLDGLIASETLINEGDENFAWPQFDEITACGLCYTSGTTGNPKGVLYTHRSNVLHAMSVNSADIIGLRSTDVVLPVVPMFHANAWSLTYSAPMAGSKLVMPGSRLDGQSVYELLEGEAVSFSAAVPTIWLMLLQYLEESGKTLPILERVAIGGSACPLAVMQAFKEKYDVEVLHAWGMTEMSPIGTIASSTAAMEGLSDEELWGLKQKQGRAFYSVQLKIVDDDNNEQPRDGVAYGALKVRGTAVAKSYLKGEGRQAFDAEGWFDTGDVGTIDTFGYFQITDRSKDVIKSGGEWISSIDLENVAVGHPDVAEAAVIGIAHPKWDERPLLVIVANADTSPSKDGILKFLEGKIAKWWMPDDVVFIDEIPHTATGKINKLGLRQKFSDYELPTAKAAE